MQRGISKKKAFTLVELLVVVVVIAILAGLIIPMFDGVRAQTLLTACETNEKTLANALELYATDNQGSYPMPVAATVPPLSGQWSNYIPTVLLCPANKTAYVYQVFPVNAPSQYTLSQGGAAPAHPLLNAGYPQYSPSTGLVLR